jgi:BspA type Leucine rich repeat region (6 copies)
MPSNNRVTALFAATAVLFFVSRLSAEIFGPFVYADQGASVIITAYTGKKNGTVEIPSVIAGKPVTEIGERAFANHYKETGFIIPATVTLIGDLAFNNCSKVLAYTVAEENPNYSSSGGVIFDKLRTRLIQYPCGLSGAYDVPAGVSAIADRAFERSILSEVTMSASVTDIGTAAFSRCFQLIRAVLSSGATRLGDEAFFSNFRLEKVNIPSGVPRIGDRTFYHCWNLSEVTVGTGLESIGYQAFIDCTNLIELSLPASLTLIEASAFMDCKDLERIHFRGDAPQVGQYAFGFHFPLPTVYVNEAAEGFTFPTWKSCRTVVVSKTAEIAVQQPIGTGLLDGAARKSFGTAVVGEVGTTKTFVIKNRGSTPLDLLRLTTDRAGSKHFKIFPPRLKPLAPGATTTFKVIFRPMKKGSLSTVLQIRSTDADENPFDIRLSGLGVAP